MYKKFIGLSVIASLTACGVLPTERLAPDEEAVVVGAAVRRNFTPLEPAFTCLADNLRQQRRPAIGIAVGDVKDYTGKYNQNEGNAITQGGALMAYSALGKLGDVVQLHERFDTRIGELELAYTDRRQLGDGQPHAVESGKPPVAWVPYFGGSILGSQYYVIGGITEVNYDIQSGGADVSVSNVGGKRRTYTMNIGVDLRLVDTRTLLVVKTVSLQKQIKGEEVGVGVYRFFGSELLDLTVGAKRQEPLQLGVRTTIEQGILELVAAVGKVDVKPCLELAADQRKATVQAKVVVPVQAPAAPVALAAAPVVSASKVLAAGTPLLDATSTQSGQVPQNAGASQQDAGYDIEFDVASAAISPRVMSLIDKIVSDAALGKRVSYKLLSRDSEVYPPMQRDELINQRLHTVSDLLVARGVQAARISVTWRPEPTDGKIFRYENGLQLLARISLWQ
ncbi:CsgG/HfaB family protein [Rhodoferax sp. PAMC 29310]|uniref:CsgG/HfaB family protein n=1 Tax=Rhodoferax sp. PAMC 29310 TaxID=2822760 RepID=UPI001B327C35|nr:CsgG/HfaB family protein [Rhodoferax sp. PAMC 29310]